MKANVGIVDMSIRILAGVVLIGLAIAGVIGWWGYIGILPLATGLMKFCPAYAILGISTKGKEEQDKSR